MKKILQLSFFRSLRGKKNQENTLPQAVMLITLMGLCSTLMEVETKRSHVNFSHLSPDFPCTSYTSHLLRDSSTFPHK